MARSPTMDKLSLAQLERLMSSRRTEVHRLTRRRDTLQRKLDALNARIYTISGGNVPGPGGGGHIRARNAVSLQDAIIHVLTKAGGPMKVGDIMDRVHSLGYRSNSANFRGIVNQTLIKDKRFTASSRGTYQLKK
ncbi:MAG TPA: hypothetical protein VH475_17115 [Tepidisphaeraceae bacterium]|jgi:hypothetical protein